MIKYENIFLRKTLKAQCYTLAVSLTRGGVASGAMPFIDDTLLWCPDNDGRMVDISACLQVMNGGLTGFLGSK